jgi:tetratricopeptide (TPR) repeat protein
MIIYTPDSARYLVWANSLAQGEGLQDLSAPEPTCYVVHAPMYPFLLVPSAFFFPQSVYAAKVTTLLVGCFVLLLFYLWLRKTIGDRCALLGSLFLALNSYMMIYSTQILSDVPFAFCLILYGFFAEKILEKETSSLTLKIGFIIVIICGVFLREVGFTLLIGAVLLFLWKKNFRYALLIFISTVSVYLLWYVRNEIIVANIENPSLRNTNFYFMHLYTTGKEPLIAEFIARLQDNISVYMRLIGNLIFIPAYPQHAVSFLSANDPLVPFVLSVYPILQWALVLATIILCVVGVKYQMKNSKTVPFLFMFLICYSGLILLYPINDGRFLFPFLLVMIYFCTAGMKNVSIWIDEKNIWMRNVLSAAVIMILLLPNGIWMMNYIRNSRHYRQSPEQFYERVKSDSEYPWLLTKPFPLAAEWIVQHSDSSTVVVSRWKELTFWLNGRKIIDAEPQLSPDAFDRLLRDYPVHYIVGAVSFLGLNEYESLMIRSRLFAFKKVHRFANIEIYEVIRQKQKVFEDKKNSSPDSETSMSWHRALSILEDNPWEAENIIQRLTVNHRAYTEGMFHLAVAKEFAMELDSALMQFEKVRLMPQAGAFVQQSSFHMEIIALLQQAKDTTVPLEQAERFVGVASKYWQLGFRKQAISMLQQSLRMNPNLLLSHIFRVLFSLQLGDTLAARESLHIAQAIDSSNPFVTGLVALLHSCDSLARISNIEQRHILQLSIARTYLAMGLQEDAIEELYRLLQSDPNNQQALSLQGALYESTQRYSSAAEMYGRLVRINPTDSNVQRKYRSLSLRLCGCSKE